MKSNHAVLVTEFDLFVFGKNLAKLHKDLSPQIQDCHPFVPKTQDMRIPSLEF